MSYFVVLITLGLLLYLLKRARHLSRWDHFPGMKSWSSIPTIGHAYALRNSPIKSMFTMNEKYGDVFRCDIRGFPTVVLCKYEDVMEAFKKDAFSGRPYHLIPSTCMARGVDSEGNISGVTAASGYVWKEHRQFMLSNLTQLGMGKKDVMGEILEQEAEEFCNNLLEGQIQVKGLFSAATNNVIWRIVTNEKHSQTDPVIVKLTKNLKDIMDGFTPGNIIRSIVGSSTVLMNITMQLGLPNLPDLVKPVSDFIYSSIKNSKADHQGTMIERYLAEIQKNEGLSREKAAFFGPRGRNQIFGGFLDYLLAGTDTSATFLEWASLYMAAYPDIQDKVYQEIYDQIGCNRKPRLSDKKLTPFCEAVIEEIMRMCPEIYINLPHYVTEDTEAAGYHFPKGTQVIAFYGSILRNPKQFPNPNEFYPERYIDSEGKFKSHPHVAFFGLGKRRCVGEMLGKEEVYIFFVSIIQTFKLSIPIGQKVDFEPQSGLTFSPKPFKCNVEPR